MTHRRVLVTGASSTLGRALCAAILGRPGLDRLVTTGPEPVAQDARARHVRADLRDEFLLRSLLEEEEIRAIVHLAFRPPRSGEEVACREVNVGGALAVLEAANKSRTVGQLLIASSTFAYGARRGNPRPLRETHPLRERRLPHGVQHRLVEEELSLALPHARRDLRVAILRLCAVAGDPATDPLAPLWKARLGLTALLRNGGMQYLALEDAAASLLAALDAEGLSGAFNVTPDDEAPPSALYKELGRPRLPLPYFALALCLRLKGAPKGAAAWLSCPTAASNEKAKKALAWSPRRRSAEALALDARFDIMASSR